MRSASNLSRSFFVLKTDVIALPWNVGSRTERTTYSDQRPPRTHQYQHVDSSLFKQTTHLLLGRVKTNLTQGLAIRCKVANGNARRIPQTPSSPRRECRLPADLPTPISCPSHHATRLDCHMQGVQF